MSRCALFFIPFLLIAELAGAEAPVKLRVGSSPVLSSAGIYLAESQGFFKAQGLDVEIIDVANSGAPITLLLAKGEFDVGAGNLTSGLFKAIAQDERVKIVADKGHVDSEHDYIALLVRKSRIDSGRFRSLKDLKGFKAGLTSLDGVSQQIVMEKFLAKAGLAPNAIEYVKLSYAEMNTALKTGSLDATVQLEPFVAQAELSGYARRVNGAAEVHPGQQSAAILYSKKLMSNRANAVKFMTAYLQGVRLYNQSLKDPAARAKVRAALGKKLRIKDEKLWNAIRPIGLSDDGALNLETLQADLDWYHDKGYLPRKIRAGDVVDASFAAEAVKALNAN